MHFIEIDCMHLMGSFTEFMSELLIDCSHIQDVAKTISTVDALSYR